MTDRIASIQADLAAQGFSGAIGLPRPGAVAQYRRSEADGTATHVIIYSDGRVEHHVDNVDPRVDPVGHIQADVLPMVSTRTKVRAAQVAGAIATGGIALLVGGPVIALSTMGIGGLMLGAAVARKVVKDGY